MQEPDLDIEQSSGTWWYPRKKLRKKGLCKKAWRIEFMKHVAPKFLSPLRPRHLFKEAWL
jgi:hypothetical protein